MSKQKDLSVEEMKAKIAKAEEDKINATAKKITDILEQDGVTAIPLFVDANKVMNDILTIINNAPKTLSLSLKPKDK